MDIQSRQTNGRLDVNKFGRWIFSVLLLIVLSIVVTGCVEVTDPDWLGRSDMNTPSPTSPAPPSQWGWQK